MTLPVRQRVNECAYHSANLQTNYDLLVKLIYEGYLGVVIDSSTYSKLNKNTPILRESPMYDDFISFNFYTDNVEDDIWNIIYKGTRYGSKYIRQTGWNLPVIFFTDEEALLKFVLIHNIPIVQMED